MGGADTLTERVRILSKRHDNRTCGDCEQLGPTYVNCTIGSFVCTTCSGILRGLNPPHRIKSVGLSKFSLAEVEFVEQYGNENVEAKWMGKYDERCGKKLSKESPLYKTYLEDKYERKCWLDDSFKLVPKSFDDMKKHFFKIFRAKAEESDKRRNKYDSSSNSGTNSSISRDGEADYQVNRNNLSTASLGGDSGFSNDDFFADFDSVNWQTFNDKGSKQAGQRTSSLIEPFQTMSFSQGEDSASKTASLPAPQIHPQNTFVAMNSQTLPAKGNLFAPPALGNPFRDFQNTTPRNSFNANHGQFTPHSDAAFGSPMTQPLTYQNYQSSSARSVDRYSALADLDASVKAEAMNARRYKLQKQVSVGQQIFGAAPSSANPFLKSKRQSFVQYPSHSIAPSCMYSSNPFSSGDPTNPFL